MDDLYFDKSDVVDFHFVCCVGITINLKRWCRMITVGVAAATRRGKSGTGWLYSKRRTRREQSRPHSAGIAGSDLDAS